MGNQSSLASRKKQQNKAAAAKLPQATSSTAQLDAVPPLAIVRLPEQPQPSSREDSAREDILTPRPTQPSGTHYLDPDADPLEFVLETQSSVDSGSSEHAFLQYSQALCLQVKQNYAAASALYRELVSLESPVTLEAHFRFAQCIMMQQSYALPDNATQEAQASLEHVLSATSGSREGNDAFVDRMRAETTELLAHLFSSQSRFREALDLYDSLPKRSRASPAVVYQRAFCHHALSINDEEDSDADELLDPHDDLALLQVDAKSNALMSTATSSLPLHP